MPKRAREEVGIGQDVKLSYDAWAERDRAIRSVARTPTADLLLRYFNLAEATGAPDARWQHFQVAMLNSDATFACYNKARQIGFSFTAAAMSLAEVLLNRNRTAIFISFNLDEAKEKMRYVRQWWAARHPAPELVPARGEFTPNGVWQGESPTRVGRWPELVKSNEFEMAWDNGSRLLSHPARPPRGKKASVVLDEMAHIMHANAVYTAAVPMITRGILEGHRIIIGSTPMGASGKFWEIFTDEREYMDYFRASYGWWEVEQLCRDREACQKAFERGVQADEMVALYGTAEMRKIRRNVNYDDFLQEYNLQFLDSSYAFLSWELIQSCYPSYWRAADDLSDEMDFEEASERGYGDAYIAVKARGLDRSLAAVRELALAIDNGFIGDRLCLGYDCGRDLHASEVAIFEERDGHYYQRAMLTLHHMEFEQQKVVLASVFRDLPIVRGWLDKGGIGREVAEWAEKRFGLAAQGVTFDNARKERWANNLKLAMERGKVTLIPDREQSQQLHSISVRVTDAKNFKYEVAEEEATIVGGKRVRHHADKFWAIALAVWCCAQIEQVHGQPYAVTGKRAAPEGQIKIAKAGFRPQAASARDAAERIGGKLRKLRG